MKGGTMAWLILFVAGLFEIGWAVGLKYTEGFTRLGAVLDDPARALQCEVAIHVGTGVERTQVILNYRRGLFSFAPLEKR